MINRERIFWLDPYVGTGSFGRHGTGAPVDPSYYSPGSLSIAREGRRTLGESVDMRSSLAALRLSFLYRLCIRELFGAFPRGGEDGAAVPLPAAMWSRLVAA